MTDKWQPGEVVLMREYLGRAKAPRLINVLPEVVVHDGADYLAYCHSRVSRG